MLQLKNSRRTKRAESKSPESSILLLKLSGEAFGQGKINPSKVEKLAQRLAKIQKTGTTFAIVIGGGNFWRFRDQTQQTFLPRQQSDFLGMLATFFNGVVLTAALKKFKVAATTFSKVPIPRELALPYNKQKIRKKLQNGELVILIGGTGRSGVTTDTAAAQFAIELKCQGFLKATNVRGIFNSDPKKNPRAKFLKALTFAEALQQKIGVCDQNVFRLLKPAKIPVLIFNFQTPNNLEKAARGELVGSKILP